MDDAHKKRERQDPENAAETLVQHTTPNHITREKKKKKVSGGTQTTPRQGASLPR